MIIVRGAAWLAPPRHLALTLLRDYIYDFPFR
jgi:hypothetical protein